MVQGVRLEIVYAKACAGSNPVPTAFMRVIFLNTWGGRLGKPFDSFIKKCSSDTDIFCFQEVSPSLFSRLSLLLPKYGGIYEKGWDLAHEDIWYGQAVFVRNDVDLGKFGKVDLFKSGGGIGFMQYAHLTIKGNKLLLVNIHGKSKPAHKLDTPVRLRQSKTILQFLAKFGNPKIIGGDFNLMPGTKSIGLFEEYRYRNLIKDFGIKSTRNEISWSYHKKSEDFVKQYFADYCFVSPEIKVKGFEVPDIEISDHLPLILDFEI